MASRATAAKNLVNQAFEQGLRLSPAELEVLNGLISGGTPPRRANVTLGAIRLKLEYGHTKPAQAHEHNGTVSIVVRSALAGAPGSAVLDVAKVSPVATGHEQVLCFQQPPITAIMSTRVSGVGNEDSYLGRDQDGRSHRELAVGADVFDL